MYFSIDREVLVNSLNVIQKGLPVKTPNPILTGIKIIAADAKVTLISSNTDVSVKTIISDGNIDIKTEGCLVVPGKYFIDIIKKLETKRVEIFLIEDKIVNINSERSEFKLNSLEADYYPDIEFIEKETPICLDSKILKSLIRETSFAASTSEKRPILTGVNFKYDGDAISSVATDSFRLSKKVINIPNLNSNFNVVVPFKSLDEFYRTIESYNGDVFFYINNNKILFKYKNILYQARLLEGNYPDTSRLIPNNFPIIIKFNRDELLNTIDRVSLLSSKDYDNNFGIIKLNLSKEHVISITSTNSEIGGASEEIIPLDTVIGDSLHIAFSSKYLIDALKSCVSNTILICFTGSVKPFIVKGEPDDDLINLILPVKFD